MKKKYKVLLAISVLAGKAETIYGPGDVAELDDETAGLYAHALQRVEEEE